MDISPRIIRFQTARELKKEHFDPEATALGCVAGIQSCPGPEFRQTCHECRRASNFDTSKDADGSSSGSAEGSGGGSA